MQEDPGHPKPGAKSATPDEVRLAIESLTEADMAKLYAFAEILLFKVRRHTWGVGAGDLLQEAMVSLLDEGRRNWRPERVSLVGFLIGAMQSIASNWKRKGAGGEKPPKLASDLGSLDERGEEIPTALDTTKDEQPNPEKALLAREQATEEQLIAEIEELFKGDVVASLVLNGWKNGMKGPEITASLEISRKEFAAAVRRIRRAVGVRWPEGKPYVQ